MPTFEVIVYNKDVRDHVRDNKKHPHYDEGWGDQRFFQVKADNMDHVRKIMTGRHPPQKGFVIVDITEMPEYQ